MTIKNNKDTKNKNKVTAPKTQLTESGLRPEQELFCKLYTSKEFFAHGTEAYAEAYGLDLKKKGNYNTAKSNGHRLLTNADILKRINELLDEGGLNESFVDKQLLFIINQNADMSTKMRGISEFNKLKGRITDKLQAVTTNNVNVSGELDADITNVLKDNGLL